MFIIYLLLFQPLVVLTYNNSAVIHKSLVRDVLSSAIDNSNIKEAILDKINKYSAQRGNKADLLETIENTEDKTDMIKDAVENLVNSENLQVKKFGPSANLPSNMNFGENFASSVGGNDREFGQPRDTLSTDIHIQKLQLEDANNNRIRDWRVKFYKAFRNARKHLKNQNKTYQTTWEQAAPNTDKTVLNNIKRTVILDKNPDSEREDDDWNKFLSLRNIQAHSANDARSQATDLESSGYQYKYNASHYNTTTPYKIQLALSTTSPTFYYQSYQQPFIATSSNSTQYNRVQSPPSNYPEIAQASYPNNPVSSQTVTFAFPATTSYHLYRTNTAYPQQRSSIFIMPTNRQQIQLLSEFDNRFIASTTQATVRDELLTTVYAPMEVDTLENDEFAVFDNDNYILPQNPSIQYYNGNQAVINFDANFQADERCNSHNLKTLMITNMVENDSESSKRAIQEAAEQAFGNYYNIICGTGFFSYIAHTDEFCLVSVLGINCYAFSPLCNKSFVNLKRAKIYGPKNSVNKI